MVVIAANRLAGFGFPEATVMSEADTSLCSSLCSIAQTSCGGRRIVADR
jgi:hypothetical protein